MKLNRLTCRYLGVTSRPVGLLNAIRALARCGSCYL